MARKAWLKNGKVVMRDGKVVMCEDCPCGCTKDCNCCQSGSGPAWLKLRFIAGPDSGEAPEDCPDLTGREFVLTRNDTEDGFCRYQYVEEYIDANGSLYNLTIDGFITCNSDPQTYVSFNAGFRHSVAVHEGNGRDQDFGGTNHFGEQEPTSGLADCDDMLPDFYVPFPSWWGGDFWRNYRLEWVQIGPGKDPELC